MNTQTHELSGEIRSLKKKRVYWSLNPTGAAIVFVHGLMGEAVGTWSQFELLLFDSQKCDGCDIIFYQYNSTDAPTNSSSSLLYSFLQELLTSPAEMANKDSPGLSRPRDFRYSKVLLVAHSLGAIICRQALLRAYKKRNEWAKTIQLVLFAPAHLGATDVAAFVSEVADTFKLKGVVSGSKLLWPTLRELERGSDVLKDLLAGTQKAVSDGAEFLKAKKVLFGEFDKWVDVRDFCNDEEMEVFPGKGHRDVCKPHDLFRSPLNALLELL